MIPPLTSAQVRALLTAPESPRLERKASLKNLDRVRDTICAFANDIDGTFEPALLLVGVADDGRPLYDQIPDEMLRSLVDLRNSGVLLPLPVMELCRVRLSQREEVLAVRVMPAEMPPMRSSGRIFIRRGSSTVLATETEERILIEKQEKSARSWDQQACARARLADLDQQRFETDYVPKVVGPQAQLESGRPYEERLASLRLYDLSQHKPTYGGLLLLGHHPRDYILGCEIQYVWFSGLDRPTTPLVHQLYTGGVDTMLRALTRIPEVCAPVRELGGQERPRYPEGALRELLINSVLHRQYGQASPTQFYVYRNRVEILNLGGLHHSVRFEEFGHQTGYRNPLLAEALKSYGLICRFGEGIPRVKRLLAENGNPPAEFDLNRHRFLVVMRAWQPYSAVYQEREEALRQGLTGAERQHLDEELFAVRDELEGRLRGQGAEEEDILAEVEAALLSRLVPHEQKVAARREEEAERERQIAEALRNNVQIQEAEKRAGTAEERVLAKEKQLERLEDTVRAVESRNDVLIRRIREEQAEREQLAQRAEDEAQRAEKAEQQRDEEARRAAELAQQRDEADRRAAELAQQRDEEALAAVLDLCEVFGLSVHPEHEARLAQLDRHELAALRQHLKRHRTWP